MTATKLGVTALAVLLLSGVWLIVAPFVVGYQPRGAAWTDATRNDLWTGGLLVAISFLTLTGYAAAELRALVHRIDRPTASGQAPNTTSPRPIASSAAVDTDSGG